MKLKLKYLLLGTVLSTQFLFINLAQADEWMFTTCKKMSKIGEENLPRNLEGLPNFYWGISLTNYATSTNLGTIKISFDKNSEMIYPLEGTGLNSRTTFTIIKLGNKSSEYQIDFVNKLELIDKPVIIKSSALLSACSCECTKRAPTNTDHKSDTAYDPRPPVVATPDPEEGSTSSICSCAVS